MKLHLKRLLFVCALLSGFCSAGFAQDAGSVKPDPQYIEARDRARTEFKAGRFLEAAQAFEAAFRHSARGNLLYNIGLCYEKAGEVVTAVKFYQRFVDTMTGSKQRPVVQARIKALKKQIRFQKVSVSSSPSGATIYLDDRSKGALGRAPLTFDLVPGQYSIIADLKDHETKTEKITVYEGRPAMVDLALMPSSEMGIIDFIVYERGAVVMVDGKNIGKSPIQKPIRLKAGLRTINIVKPGFTTWSRKLTLRAGSTERIEVELEREQAGDLAGSKKTGDSLGPWILTGTGVAMGLASIGFGVVASGLYSQLEDKERNGELIAPQDVETGNTLVLATNVLAGAALTAVIGGVVWWVLDDPAVERSSSLATQFTVDPAGGGSFGVGGTF